MTRFFAAREEIVRRFMRSFRELWLLHALIWPPLVIVELFAWSESTSIIILPVVIALFGCGLAAITPSCAVALANFWPITRSIREGKERIASESEEGALVPANTLHPALAALTLAGWALAFGIPFASWSASTGLLIHSVPDYGMSIPMAGVAVATVAIGMVTPIWVVGALPGWSNVRLRDPLRRGADRLRPAGVWTYAGPTTAIALLWSASSAFTFTPLALNVTMRLAYVGIAFLFLLPTAGLTVLLFVTTAANVRAARFRDAIHAGSSVDPTAPAVSSTAHPRKCFIMLSWLAKKLPVILTVAGVVALAAISLVAAVLVDRSERNESLMVNFLAGLAGFFISVAVTITAIEWLGYLRRRSERLAMRRRTYSGIANAAGAAAYAIPLDIPGIDFDSRTASQVIQRPTGARVDALSAGRVALLAADVEDLEQTGPAGFFGAAEVRRQVRDDLEDLTIVLIPRILMVEAAQRVVDASFDLDEAARDLRRVIDNWENPEFGVPLPYRRQAAAAFMERAEALLRVLDSDWPSPEPTWTS